MATSHAHAEKGRMKLSIVVPAFNEEGNLALLHGRLARVAMACTPDHELIFVDDGSRDRTLDVIRQLAAQDPRVRYVSFSRNFGHEIASTAGIDRASGDAVILMDADLQDPPEIIPQMLEKWRAGAHVVYAQRRRRSGESAFKRATAFAFYRLLSRLADVNIPHDTGDFRLMDRKVVDAFRQCRENPRFVRGLVSWVGFTQVGVHYDREERFAGQTKYSLRKLLRLSIDAITAFSLKPLKLMMGVGLVTIALSAAMTIGLVVQRLFFDTPFHGFTLLACGIFFMGGVQLIMLGMMAHYLGQIFQRAQGRPMYVVAEESGPAYPAPAPEIVVNTRRAEAVSL